ncbi:Laminin subunit beta-1, partial [Brachionus plicatilis]
MILDRFIVTLLGLAVVASTISWDVIQSGPMDSRHLGHADNFIERKMREKNQTFNGKYLTRNSEPSRAKSVKKTLNFLKAFNCRAKSCFRIGNVLLGRSNFIYANSTCGLQRTERFCILDQNMTGFDVPDRTFFFSQNNHIKGFRCMICNSAQKFNHIFNQNSHRIENVIFLNRPNKHELALKWWQAENGQQNVYIQFDLESQFLLSNIYIHFKSYPPGALVIEKSFDYGVSWQPIAYYSSNCRHHFAHIPTQSSVFFEPKCTDRYSKFDVRELIYRPLSGYKLTDGLDVATHLKMTNLRLNFSELLMFGDQHMSKNKNVMMKYFYAINEIRIMGSCFCNGHASLCTQMEDVEYDQYALDRMVHSKCLCEHDTEGNNCERCLPMFNDRPWMPATDGQVNECKKCECHGHAFSCHFSLEKFAMTNQTSGGVCDNCVHNTEGYNCERCKNGFYHDNSLPFSHPLSCKPCNCNVNGSKNFQCNSNQCECKVNVMGDNCDKCKPGYWNLEGSNPHGCL